MSAMADQGGVAIENARLFERTRQNTKLFLDMSASINSTLDIKKILNDLTVDVSQALEKDKKDLEQEIWSHRQWF